MNQIQVGVVGLGRWGRRLAKKFQDLGMLGGVCDREKKKAQGFEDVPFMGFEELLSRSLDAIAIATPPVSHSKLAIDAIRAGKDVFIEKPVCLNVSETSRLQEVLTGSDRICFVGHLLLYHPVHKVISKVLRSGELGRIYAVEMLRRKWGRVRATENVLWSFGVHDLAVLFHHFGGLSVQNTSWRGAEFLNKGKSQVFDEGELRIDFEGDLKASLRVSWLYPEDQRTFVIIGSHGQLVYDEKKEVLTLFRKRVSEDLSSVQGDSEVLYNKDGDQEDVDLLARELLNFQECVKNRRVPLTDLESASRVIQVLESVSPVSPFSATENMIKRSVGHGNNDSELHFH